MYGTEYLIHRAYRTSPYQYRMLQISNLTKAYGTRVLLDEVSLTINQGEKIGLIGRNGYGKSTLFKIICGEEEAEGEITTSKGYKIGYLSQHLKFTEASILAEAALALAHADKTYLVEKILLGIGFSKGDLAKPPTSFSGGYQLRINLAKLFLKEPDLLLLDEPTNYLDIISIRWLIKRLQGSQQEALIISHDRGFLRQVTSHTAGIFRCKVKKIAGDADKLLDAVARDEELQEKTRLNIERQREEAEDFINKFRAKASKASLVQSKIKQLEKLQNLDTLALPKVSRFDFNYKKTHAKTLLRVEDLTFGYTNELINRLSFELKPNDRLGIIGKNGLGKSTLLKLISQNISPSAGTISYCQDSAISYFAQTNTKQLDENATILDEVRSANPDLSESQIRSICGSFLFTGSEALKPIHCLSGGEKSRVILAKIVALPSNILLFDEPTSHLDMETIDVFAEAITHYQGCIIMVSHNEDFLAKTTDRLVVFDTPGSPFLYEGGYKDFLQFKGFTEDIESTSEKTTPTLSSSKDEYAKRKERQKLERSYERLESELHIIEAELCSLAASPDFSKISELSELRDDIMRRMAELLELL